jgi:beta-lactamase regulating signal transducer with metallopeptidase domain
MIATFNLDQLARISAERMLNCLLEGIVIGLFAWLLLRVVGRRNSSTRFAVWFSALLSIAALPILGVATSGARSGSVASAITVPGSWALDIFLVWAAIAGVALLRVAMGVLQLRKLRATCVSVDLANLDPLPRATLQQFQAIRAVELCQSDRVRVPAAIGFLKPAVVIPSWALQELSAEELNSILIHELAHLRRRDDWTNLAQQVLKAILFFHPAVWWIENKLALEREMACDDAVLAQTANPRRYAQCLVSMAEKSFLRRGLAMAQAIVDRMQSTSLRVSQILDVNRSRATRVWKPALYSVGAFSVVCLVSLSQAPELVAFEDPMPHVAAVSAPPAPQAFGSSRDVNFVAKQPQPTITPVVFHPGSPAALDRAAKPATHRATRRRQDSARVVKTGFVPRAAEGQGKIRSTLLIHRPPAAHAVFVVMQGTQFEQEGPMVWTLSVWHVTVLDSRGNPVEPIIPAQQI